jgi:hypothetical protein
VAAQTEAGVRAVSQSPSDLSHVHKSHLGTDWKDQWQRVLRYHLDVAIPLLDSYDHDRLVDGVVTFCKECDALPEWLIRSGFAKDAVHSVVAGSPALLWARDIANGMGHFKLNPAKATTTHKEWTTTHTEMVYVSGEGAPSADRWVFTDLDTGETLSPNALADACVEAWRNFLPV